MDTTIDLGTKAEHDPAIPSDDDPFRIAVLGDFSGRGGRAEQRAASAIASRRPIAVDCDCLDEVTERLDVRCEVAVGDAAGGVLELRFQSLADFHPDRLVETVPLLARFRQLREDLLEPATFQHAAEEVRAWGLTGQPGPSQPAGPEIEQESAPAAPALPLSDLLDQALEQTEQTERTAGPTADESVFPGGLADFVRRIAAPYRLERAPDRAELVDCVDAVTEQALHAVLHDPRFQALESAWQGLDFLVRRLASARNVQICLIDVALAELAADLAAAQQLEASGIYKLLVEQSVGTPGARLWSVLAANFTIADTPAALFLAGCLARIAAKAGAPLLAGISPRILGCDSLSATPDPDDWRAELPDKVLAAWERVRALPEASCLGLVLPRFLLRMPYGAQGASVESFPFEELLDPPEHEAYLWGNPAMACACLLAQAFVARGWRMRPEEAVEFDDLPIFTYEDDGEWRLQPCAEVLLTDRAAERIFAAGLMPLVTIQGAGAARLAGWRSVAASGAKLRGRWS